MWAKNKKDGVGTFFYANNDAYAGPWIANIKQGSDFSFLPVTDSPLW